MEGTPRILGEYPCLRQTQISIAVTPSRRPREFGLGKSAHGAQCPRLGLVPFSGGLKKGKQQEESD